MGAVSLPCLSRVQPLVARRYSVTDGLRAMQFSRWAALLSEQCIAAEASSEPKADLTEKLWHCHVGSVRKTGAPKMEQVRLLARLTLPLLLGTSYTLLCEKRDEIDQRSQVEQIVYEQQRKQNVHRD